MYTSIGAPSDSDWSDIRYQALYVLVQRLITSLTKCQTRCCVEPRPSVDDCRVYAVLERISGKTPPEQNSSGKKIKKETEEIAIEKGAFANMRSRYKETGKKVPQAYLRYVEDTFLPCDAVDALRFAKASDVISYRDNTHVITDYRYDSFGRRIHTAERSKTGMRTIYDGLTFEAVKEAKTFVGTRGITSSLEGDVNLHHYNPHGSDHTRGTRYYFIPDRGQELRTDKNGEALPDRIRGVRTYLYLNGERVAVNNLYNTNHGQYYYGSDILVSVKFITGQAGQELKRIEYDVFGGIYKGNSPYGLETGYTGKPYDSVTGLSNYGFRDYSPTHARFITEDPIRDGRLIVYILVHY